MYQKLTGTLVPIAMTTKPMVNLSTLRIHPDRPTKVTMPKLKIAIQTMDMMKEARKYFRLCGLLQSGMVQVNKQMNGKLIRNKIQPKTYLNAAQQPPSSGNSGYSADTAGKQGQGFMVCSPCCSSTSLIPEVVFSSSKGTVCVLPLESTWTTATVGCCCWIISDRRLYSFRTCCCATDLSLIPSIWPWNPTELLRCALGSS